MGISLDPKIVIVRRATRLQKLRARFGTASQAKFLMRTSAERDAVSRGRSVASADATRDFDDYQAEDDQYRGAIDVLQKDLDGIAPVLLLDREQLPTYLFGPHDIVVTVGQDGLVANAAKYAIGLPIIGSNPDPARFDGVLLPFSVEQVRRAVLKSVDGTAKLRRVTLAEVALSDGQKLLAFNDFFVGAKSHVSARYTIRVGQRHESQSSSGVLISTGAGSTGWLSSVFNMSAGVLGAFGAGGANREQERIAPMRLAWDDPRLVFIVREPFVSRMSGAALTAGMIEPNGELILESSMPAGGVIFSDGVESDFLEFSSGTIASIRAAEKKATLVVPS